MDFAEDYKCQSQDEIQSAYWNTTQVTIHPAVVYYKDDDNLKHKSFVFVSDKPGHNASTVYAILKKLIPEIKITIPDLKMVHYWTDSPTSQYRNKSILNIVCNHEKWLEREQLPGIVLRRDTEKALATGLAELLKDLLMMQSSKRKSSYKTTRFLRMGRPNPEL